MREKFIPSKKQMTYQRVLSVHKNGTFRSGTDCCGGGTVYFYSGNIDCDISGMQESLPLKIESAKLTFLCDNNAQGFISRIYLNVHFMPKHKQGLNIRILLQFLQREAIYHKERRLLI